MSKEPFVKLAKTAGFCWGVKRAIDIVLEAAEKTDKPLYTFGPLIHNPQVIELLETKNVHVIQSLEGVDSGNVVIRTHGITPEVRKEIKGKGHPIKDATCPLVAKVQAIIKKYAVRGYHTVIVGEEGHPEIIGLLGYTEGRGRVIKGLEDVDALPPLDNVCVVAQTTCDVKKYQVISARLKEKYPGCVVNETICDATEERQAEVSELAPAVDLMVVVGGKNSGNTKRLAELSESLGTHTYLIETDEELTAEMIHPFRSIGVTAGASTPNWMIQKVVNRIKELQERKRHPVSKRFRDAVDGLVESNAYVAAGAAGLTYAACLLQGISPEPIFLALAFFYIYSMYILNHLCDEKTLRLNDLEKIRFFKDHATFLSWSGATGVFLALFLGFVSGRGAFWLTMMSLMLGMAYSIKLFPAYKLRFHRLKDLPASKGIFVALAWSGVTVLVPAFSQFGHGWTLPMAVTFVFVFSLVYIRSVLFDIRDIQGDKVVGRETIPILIGKEKTKIFLGVLSGFVAVTLAASCWLQWTSSLSLFLIGSVFFTWLYLFLYHKRVISQGIPCEMTVDGKFYVTGLIALLWSILN